MDKLVDDLYDELGCPLCGELFIKAVMLPCGHVYCRYCLKRWCRRRIDPRCLVCLKDVRRIRPVRCIDNIVVKMVACMDSDYQQKRQEQIRKRRNPKKLPKSVQS